MGIADLAYRMDKVKGCSGGFGLGLVVKVLGESWGVLSLPNGCSKEKVKDLCCCYDLGLEMGTNAWGGGHVGAR